MMGFRAEVGLGLRLYLAPTIAVALVALILLPILLLLVATIAGLTFVMSMLVDRLRARHSAPLPERCWNVPQVGALHLTTRDGVALRGYIARPSAPASRDKPHRIVLLCQPLGQCAQTCGLDPFTPVILGIGDDCTCAGAHAPPPLHHSYHASRLHAPHASRSAQIHYMGLPRLLRFRCAQPPAALLNS